MALLGGGSASSRRTIVGTLFAAAMFTAVAVQAQDPAAPPAPPAAPAPADPAAQQPAAPAQEDIFKVTADEAGWLWYIKPEKEMDFQATWREIKAKLATAENPELKTLGDNLTIYKIDVPAGPQGVQYLFLADPASKTLSYSASPFLLFESKLFPDADGRRLFDVLQASVNGIGPFPLKKLQ
jgi:hypothetical protein